MQNLFRSLALLTISLVLTRGTSARPALPAGTVDPAYRPRFEKANQPYRLHPYPDGRLLVELDSAGVRLNGQEVRRLARIEMGDFVDPTFASPAFLTNAYLARVLPVADGGVYLGLSAAFPGTSAKIIHLLPDGREDPLFQLPEENSPENWYLLAIQTDGRLIAVRRPADVAGGAPSALVRLHANGQLDASFTSQINDGREFLGVWLLADGRLVVEYTPKDLVELGHIGSLWTRLKSDGLLDLQYHPPLVPNSIRHEVFGVGPDGSVFLMGYSSDPQDFNAWSRMARLGPDGPLDAGFETSVIPYASLEVTTEGHWRVLVQESQNPPFNVFWVELNTRGQEVGRQRLPEPIQAAAYPEVRRLVNGDLLIEARFANVSSLPDGRYRQEVNTADLVYSPSLELMGTYTVSVTEAVTPPIPTPFPDGSLVFPNEDFSFDQVGGRYTPGPALLTPSGDLDVPFTSWVRDHANWRILRKADGAVVTYDRSTRWVASMERDGTLRPWNVVDWGNPEFAGLGVQLQTDFSLVRISDVTSRQPAGLSPSAANRVGIYPRNSSARGSVLSDDRILLWGTFQAVGGWPSFGLARLNSMLVPDRQFRSPFAEGVWVRTAVKQDDGKIVFARQFSEGTESKVVSELGRLREDGTSDPAFLSEVRVEGWVNALAVDRQGRILVGGFFQNVAGRPSASVARLLPDGSLDTTFVRGLGADRSVDALIVLPDDSVVAYGEFRYFDGTECWGLVRLGAGDSKLTELSILGISAPRRVRSGERVVLGTVATGAAPLQFQWSHLGIPLAGATQSTLVLPAVSEASLGGYQVWVSDNQNSVRGAATELILASSEASVPSLSLLSKDPSDPPNVTLGVVTDASGKYRLEISGDLMHWEAGQSVVEGEGSVLRLQLPTGSSRQQFFRMVAQ